jgi:transposase InsO family protein
MARKVTPMNTRLIAAIAADLEEINVSAVCREHGISRKTFYRYRRRFLEEGLEGLNECSRRPHGNGRAVSEELEEEIVRLRKGLGDGGWDNGPATILWHLLHDGYPTQERKPLPSAATVWRVLVRRGFVVPEPRKRPKASYRRFESQRPNECWQIDATGYELATGEGVEIISTLDDHSRLAVRLLAVPTTTTEAAWRAFSEGVRTWGLPWRCLSDNGLAFTGRLRGYEVAFEANLRTAGVVKVDARPFHPQTCGKVERFHQTLKKWLRKQRRPRSLAALQVLLDMFANLYNHHRPHRGIGRVTPYSRWSASASVVNPGVAIPAGQRRVRVTVDDEGIVHVRPWRLHLGVVYQGKQADVVLDTTHATVFVDGQLVRSLDLNPDRHYQRSGRKRGGPKQPRPA